MFDGRRLFVGAAAAILCYQLILPPVVGLADNGDFVKVLGRFDLYGKVYRTYQFIDTVYEFHHERHWVSAFYSSEIVLAGAALGVNSLLSKDGNFDIRCIGIVHAALFLLALWLFAPLLGNAPHWPRIFVFALILLMYCDVMYVSGLNSFYMDEPAYLFLLLSAVLYLRFVAWNRKQDLILLFICVLFLATAKVQHAVLGFVFAALLYRARAMAAGIVLISVLMLWKASPADYAGYSLYNVIFVRILPHASNVDNTLKSLGLDDSYRALIGKNAYEPESHPGDLVFRKEFDRRVSAPKLAMFYALHPVLAYKTLCDSLDEAGRQSMGGNFDMSAGYGPMAESKAFAYWSNLKRVLFFQHGQRFLFTFVALSAVLGALSWLRRSVAGFVLIGAAFIELGVSSMFDAADVARHHLVFFALFDAMLIATAILLLGARYSRPWR